MRDRCRELSTPSDDYDRAVICILDDFETLLAARVEKLAAARELDLQRCAARLEHNTTTMELARARIEALRAALREIIAECAVDSSLLGPILRLARAALDTDTGA
jgi:hypothetical protein